MNRLSDDKSIWHHLLVILIQQGTLYQMTRHLISSTDTTDMTMNPLSVDKSHLTSSTGNTNMTMNPLSDDKTLTLQQQQPLVEHANRIVFPYPQKHPLRTSMVLTLISEPKSDLYSAANKQQTINQRTCKLQTQSPASCQKNAVKHWTSTKAHPTYSTCSWLTFKVGKHEFYYHFKFPCGLEYG